MINYLYWPSFRNRDTCVTNYQGLRAHTSESRYYDLMISVVELNNIRLYILLCFCKTDTKILSTTATDYDKTHFVIP